MTAFVGHDAAETAFFQAFASGRLHHAWLLAGPAGLGKSHFARRAAAFLLAPQDERLSSGLAVSQNSPTSQMIAEDRHPDCHYLRLGAKDDKEARKQADGKPFDLARNIKVDQIRQLIRRLTMRPSLSDRRAIIIDPADLMERNAANALLKSLEEPPPGTFFFLVSHNPGGLLPTIRSRCLTLGFAPLDDGDMAQAIRLARPDLGDREVEALVRIGEGAPGQALAYAGLDMPRIDQIMRQIVKQGDHDQQGRIALAALMAGKGQKDRFLAFLRYAPGFAARSARHLRGDRLPHGIAAWREISDIAARSIILNLDPQSVTYRIGGLLADIAPRR
ncbi:MAG: DNA polymerase III subunit delta' [Blastomonas sp.]